MIDMSEFLRTGIPRYMTRTFVTILGLGGTGWDPRGCDVGDAGKTLSADDTLAIVSG